MSKSDTTITNGDRIRSMSDEALADFLAGIAYARNTPWSEPFSNTFCKTCPTVEVTLEGYHEPMNLTECDFSDGVCPHGRDMVWWLQQPAEDEGGGSDG